MNLSHKQAIGFYMLIVASFSSLFFSLVCSLKLSEVMEAHETHLQRSRNWVAGCDEDIDNIKRMQIMDRFRLNDLEEDLIKTARGVEDNFSHCAQKECLQTLSIESVRSDLDDVSSSIKKIQSELSPKTTLDNTTPHEVPCNDNMPIKAIGNWLNNIQLN